MDPVFLDALTAADCEEARSWRNAARATLRTPYHQTAEMQAAFYRDIVCNPQSRHRYWAVRQNMPSPFAFTPLVGMVGLVGVEWENRLAEISLVVSPSHQRQGVGSAAVDLVLAEAFDRMALLTVWGECYEHNPAIEFWRRHVARYGGTATTLPRRKFHAGQLSDSYVFTFTREAWDAGARIGGAEPAATGFRSPASATTPGDQR